MPGSFAGTFQERLLQKCSPLLISNFLHATFLNVGAGSRDSSKNAKVGDSCALLRNHGPGEARLSKIEQEGSKNVPALTISEKYRRRES